MGGGYWGAWLCARREQAAQGQEFCVDNYQVVEMHKPRGKTKNKQNDQRDGYNAAYQKGGAATESRRWRVQGSKH